MTRPTPALWLLALVALCAFVACGSMQSGSAPDYDRGSQQMVRERTVSRTSPGVAVAAMESADSGGGLFDDVLETEVEYNFDDESASGDFYDTAQAEPPPEKLEPAEAVAAEAAPSATVAAPDQPAPPSERLVIYTGDVALYVLDVALAIERTLALSESLGGWLQASTSSQVVVRVPAEQFQAFVDGLEGIGRIVERNVVGQDVTEEFYDLEIRLHNAMVLRERFQELLARATTVEETLAIEKELARLTTEIERIKGRLRFLREHTAYSTVTVRFFEDASQLRAGQRVQLPFGWLTRYGLPSLYGRY